VFFLKENKYDKKYEFRLKLFVVLKKELSLHKNKTVYYE